MVRNVWTRGTIACYVTSAHLQVFWRSEFEREHKNTEVDRYADADIIAKNELHTLIIAIFVCPMQCMALDKYKITWVYVCLFVCLSACLSEIHTVHTYPQFLSDLPQIWNVGHTSDNKD